MAARGDRRINTTSYQHPQETHLLDLHYAMEYNALGEPVVRTTVDGINLEGNVIVSNVTVYQGTIPWEVTGNTTATISGNVNLGSLPDASITAFEEPVAVQLTPVLQAEAVYGLDPDIWDQSVLRGGTISTQNSTWRVASGTSAGGYARLATANYVTYLPGQGAMFRWTAAFTATGNTRNALGVDNIVQNTGPIDREDGYSIGFSGNTVADAYRKIGILHRRGGKAELRQLTITTPPGGAQTANITLDGTSFLIPITTSANTTGTAHQIASGLQANVTANNTWDIEACDSTVTFSYYSPGARSGSYSFSSTGTGTLAAGTITQLTAGASPTDEWTYVDSWNGTVPAFDPTKLNVFGMDMRWLGAGIVRFFMEDPSSGKLVVIHTQRYTSTALVPHIINPSLRIVYRSGTTNPAITPSSNVIVTGASVFGGIQGTITQTALSQGYYNTDSTQRSQNVVHHLMSVQNPMVRSSVVNKTSLVMQDLTISCQGNDPSVVFIIKNAVGLDGALLFNPLPNTTPYHFAQYAVNELVANISQNNVNNIQTVGINSTGKFDLLPYNLVLAPSDFVSVFFISTAPITRTAIGMTWRVD